MLVGAALVDPARIRAPPQHTNANIDQTHESRTEAAVSDGSCKVVLDATPKKSVLYCPALRHWQGPGIQTQPCPKFVSTGFSRFQLRSELARPQTQHLNGAVGIAAGRFPTVEDKCKTTDQHA